MTKKKIDFEKGFSDAVQGGQKEWVHDRSTTCGASEVFNCIRSLRFSKLHPELADPPREIDPEDREEDEFEGWGHTERGNLIENHFAVPALREMFGPDKALFMGDEQKTLVDGRLSATPDGVIIDLPRDALAKYGVEDIETGEIMSEIKSFHSQTEPPRKKAKTKHIGQVNVQMHLVRKLTNYQPTYGAVLYISPTNLEDIRTRIVKYDPDIAAQAVERANRVFDPNLELKDFLAEGKISGTDCTYCKFRTACQKIEMDFMPEDPKKQTELDKATLAELELAGVEVAAIRKEYKELEKRKKEAEALLRAKMFDAGAKKIETDKVTISISKNGGRKSIDKDALIADGIDPDEYMRQGDPYFVMRVSGD